MQSYIPKISKVDWNKFLFLKMVGYFYGGVIFIGLCKGGLQGCYIWGNWLANRKQITIGSEKYDPIINNVRDVGQWGFYVLQSGIGSALIVATSPISVPLLLKYKGVPIEPHNQQK